MAHVILITGSETLLGRKLVEKELGQGNRVVAPVGTKSGTLSENNREDLLVLPWNRSSVFSAKTVVREAERQFGPLNKALFLSPGFPEPGYLMEMSVSETDELVDFQIRGFLYLLREVTTLLQEKNQGQLCFALRKGKTSLPLQQGSSGFFKDFTDQWIQEPHGSLVQCAFRSDSADVDSYSRFILDIMESIHDKARGQWLKHSDKKNLFSSLPIEKRN